MRRYLGLAALVLLLAPAAIAHPAATPAEVADGLLAADRAFAEASMKTDSVAGMSAMFADDVAMPLPTGSFTRSKAEAVEALRGNPKNVTSHAEWAPIRVGVSADGTQGFTIGYMVLHDAEGPARKAKYLAYWVKKPEGWRVASYKRSPQGEGEHSTAMMAPVLPAQLTKASTDSAVLAEAAKSIDAAERGFSDEAQLIGLGPAFCKHGAPDATNQAGPGPAIVVGVQNICAAVAGPPPTDPNAPKSSVAWAPDKVLVASSGDLGITWGMIRRNGAVLAGAPAAFPYTTVWVRSGPGQPWKYIAE
jgi:ketosteroid isomerase-like protein